MKTRTSIIALCAVLTAFNSTLLATTTQLSPGLDDVVKLSKAGVSESVILTYVQSSGVMYSPSAQDLIQLREAGVSPQVTSVLMQSGAEIRKIALKSQQQAQAAAQASAQTTAAQSTQQPTTYAAAPTYVTPPAASASTVTYIGTPTFFNYPVGYSSCYYPRYYYPRSYSYYPAISLGFSFGSYHGHCR